MGSAPGKCNSLHILSKPDFAAGGTSEYEKTVTSVIFGNSELLLLWPVGSVNDFKSITRDSP